MAQRCVQFAHLESYFMVVFEKSWIVRGNALFLLETTPSLRKNGLQLRGKVKILRERVTNKRTRTVKTNKHSFPNTFYTSSNYLYPA